MRLHCPPASCSAPQVRVRLLDANLGRGRSGLAHRTFSTHDLWPSTPIRSPALRSPAKHNAGDCSTSSLLLSFTSPRFTGLCGFVKPAQITWHERNLHFCGCPVQRPQVSPTAGRTWGTRHRVFLNQTKSMIVRSFSFPPFRKRGERMGHAAKVNDRRHKILTVF
jgi:hypothetical protein